MVSRYAERQQNILVGKATPVATPAPTPQVLPASPSTGSRVSWEEELWQLWNFAAFFFGILCKILGHRIHVGNVVLEWFGDKNSICISCFMPQYFWETSIPIFQTKKSGSHVPDVHNTVLMAQMTYVCTCLII